MRVMSNGLIYNFRMRSNNELVQSLTPVTSSRAKMLAVEII